METEKVSKFENFHIVLWLFKDICWVSGMKIFGTIMIVPTVSLAIYILWITRKSKVQKYHNLAVVCWISANSLWMLGELYFDETPQQYLYEYSRIIATCLFIAGILSILWYHFEKRILKRSQTS